MPYFWNSLCLTPFLHFLYLKVSIITLIVTFMTVSHEGNDVPTSPHALRHSDADSSDDENDDESFQGGVMSPAPSSASDSSYSATDIGIYFL